MKLRSLSRTRGWLGLALATAALAAPAQAQPQPAPPPPPPPAAPAAPTLPPQMPDPIAAALAPRPGGLTPEEAGRIAARIRPSVRSKQEDLRAAAARVDQALVSFFPRLSLSATMTRLSPIDTPSLGTIVGFNDPKLTTAGPAFVGPCSAAAPTGPQCLLDANGKPAGASPLKFDVPLNSYNLTASLAVPVSDYVLRLSHSYAAASHNEKAARLSADAEGLQAASDGKIAYFNWVRARGGVVVAAEAVEQARAHVDDAKKAFGVGLASKADVFRIEAQLAAAQQAVAEAQAFSAVAEEQMRIVVGAPADKPLEIGSDVLHDVPAPPGDTLQALQEQALTRRLEIRSLDETIYSLKKVETLTKAGYAPRLDAFADATYANPNQRVFPSSQTWTGTWDLGLRLSWTINDSFSTIGAAAEARARAASVTEQKGALRDGLRLEVASAYADLVKSTPTIEAADRGLVAAEEGLRVRRELFRNGKATSSELVDAEAELTRARLSRLNARIGLLVARAKLDHATGRDVPARPVE
jgi:outer membrane protein TolC